MSQAIPFGPAAVADGYLLTQAHYTLAVPAGDTAVSSIFKLGYARRVYCGAAGTVALQGASDAVMVSYVVQAGQYLDGRWIAVGGTASPGGVSSSAAMSIVLEL
jgi:hypothetical protein